MRREAANQYGKQRGAHTAFQQVPLTIGGCHLSDDKPLAGQAAIVTGGVRRIGRATALALARAGAAVVINARSSREEADQVAEEIGAAGGRALAAEFATRGITVNCVVPGRIGGERSATSGRGIAADPPVGREGVPEDVANMICTLCLPSSGYITGQTIHVNGGLFMP